MALSKLLQHGVVSGDPRLSQIVVQGDQISPQLRVNARTRSQKKDNPDEFTSVPLLVGSTSYSFFVGPGGQHSTYVAWQIVAPRMANWTLIKPNEKLATF